jgi:serine/threonine protein kinase
MSELRKGTQLAGRYTLKQELGGGGEAQTWLASDRMTGTSVTLKVALPGTNLRDEWRTGIRLMHAHIGRVFEFHDEAEASFYSRQFVDGPDISVLSGADIEHILAPIGLVAEALAYAHSRDVVHRDVKAANILLDSNGAPYLIDFGVAAAPGEAATGGSLISASPQQLAGMAPQPSDDVFALGGLIYELISGHSPYSSSATEADIRDRVPAPLRAADGSEIPAPVQSLVASMLDKDAAARPDAATVVEELAAAGYAPSPAPRQYVANRARANDEIIEASVAVTPRRRADAAETPFTAQPTTRGLDKRTVAIALAVLILILLSVVFLLPSTVTVDSSSDDADPGQERQPTIAMKDDTQSDALEGDEEAQFNENLDAFESRDERLRARAKAEEVLGELLSHMETLEARGVQRWGGVRFAEARKTYEEGDAEYLEKDYTAAAKKYREAVEMVEPLIDEVDNVFQKALSDAEAAFNAGETVEAIRLFELAVAISPNHVGAQEAYRRATNLDTVLSLVNQGVEYEKDLELEAALRSFEQAIELDPEWQAAQEGIVRVNATIKQMTFDQRMTEGLTALEQGDYQSARAAFTMARALKPESREPADGLLQVDQGIKLGAIASLERQAHSLESGEQWAAAGSTYEEILKIDANLEFAKEGLSRSRGMEELHKRLSGYIEDPDVLSSPSTMQAATTLVVDITRMPEIGPRLADKRDELTRLLKRAATPLTVQLVSDNLTNVSIYRVGKLGVFASRDLKLRPGTYVAVGSRPGYRDVRLEFRVAPEIEMQPIIVRCEEQI